MLKKIGMIASSLGAMALMFFSQLTMSGTEIAFESAELTTLWEGIQGGLSSYFGFILALWPYFLIIAIVWIVVWLLINLARLKIGKGRRK